MHQNRTLIRGDNLTEMRNFPDACIDLIATDPPFNSKRDYFVPFRDEHGQEPDTLVKAFTDTWTWGEAAEDAYGRLIVDVGGQVGDTIQGLRQFLNETPMMAYLVMMAIRLVEMHRILKDTGSLYLHCDPTASHYLKIVLDAIFGTNNLRNEIVWCYSRPSAPKQRQLSRVHDIIFWYSKGEQWIFNPDQIRQPYAESSRAREGYSAQASKVASGSVELDANGKFPESWIYISPLKGNSREYMGYPTQKPRSLYERIIRASSNKGDLVLDPFCGCGTTLMAAEELNREWIGIDLTYLAIGAVRHQFETSFPQHRDSITIAGTPENAEQALQLASSNPHGFEEWCATHVLKFKANVSRGGDGGIDGTFRFPIGRVQGRQAFGKAVAQVKGGNYTLGHIRDFRTAMQNVESDLGVFVVTTPPTRGMRTEASRAGTYRHPSSLMEYPVLQIFEIQAYFNGVLPKLPVGERSLL